MADFQLIVHEHLKAKLMAPNFYLDTFNSTGPMWGGLDNLLRITKEVIKDGLAKGDSNEVGFAGEYVILRVIKF